MQNEQSQKQLIEQYEREMPPEILAMIKSFDWRKEVRTIVNQNQLMIDVGADLEESIYLMVLGIISVGDLYERLVETHEIPDDKARKIIQEVEDQIFNPLHKKLIELDGVEESNNVDVSKEPILRDEILAEIEKPEPEIKLNFNITKESDKKEEVKIDSTGITKPFTLSTSNEIKVEEPALPEGKIIEEVKEEHIETALNNPTVTQTPNQSQSPSKGYVVDPYREPIE